MAIGDNGIKKKQGVSGYFLIRNDSKPQYIGSWCAGNDYKIAIVDSNGAYPLDTEEYVIYGQRTDKIYNINFDTTDCFDATKKNTVRDMSPICGAAPAKVSVGIYGGGTFRFENTAVDASGLYSGGTVVSNSATVAILKGSCPGRGNLALRDTAVLSLPDSAAGTANVFGTLALDTGTGIAFGKLASGTTPLSVGSLSVATASGDARPCVSVDCSGLAAGTYTLVESAASLPADAADALRLQASNVEADVEASLVKSGNLLQVKLAVPPNVWTGLGGNGDFSNGANWKDGNAPVAGIPLDFTGLATNATLNVDIPNTTFPKLAMGNAVVTFTGAITASEITDTSKVAVGVDATVTLDGNLVFASATDKAQEYIINKVDAGGTFAVTGIIESNAAGKGYVLPAINPGDGMIAANGLAQNSSCSDGPSFRLVRDAAGTTRWVVGAKGIVGTKDYWMLNNSGRPATEIKPDTADFIISAKIGNRQLTTLTFDTTGRDGKAHTISITGGIYREGSVVAKGTGTLACDYAISAANSFTIRDSATLALASGSNIGTGAVTMHKGTSLALDAVGYQFKGSFATAAGSGEKVAVRIGAGTIAEGTYTVFSATGITAGDGDFILANGIPSGCKAEFSVSGKELKLSVFRDVFVESEVVTLSGGEQAALTTEQAAWLNGIQTQAGTSSTRADVAAALADVAPDEMEDACLLNLDITNEDWRDWSFEPTGISVAETAAGLNTVTVGIRLNRSGAVQTGGKNAPIKGKLHLYAYSLSDGAKTYLGEAAIDSGDATFAESDEARFVFTTAAQGGFYRVTIEK